MRIDLCPIICNHYYCYNTATIIIDNDDSTNSGPVTPGRLPPKQDAAISLPATLFQRVDNQESVGVFFAFYETATLFPVSVQSQNAIIEDGEIIRETEVGSQIVAATIDSDQEIIDLEDPVTIMFRLQINTTTEVVPLI